MGWHRERCATILGATRQNKKAYRADKDNPNATEGNNLAQNKVKGPVPTTNKFSIQAGPCALQLYGGSGEYVRSVGARDRGRRRTSFSSCHKLLRPRLAFVLATDNASPATLGGALFVVDSGRMSLRHAEMPPPYAGGAGSGSVSDGLGSRGIVRRELNLGRSGDRVLRARSGDAVRGLFASRPATPARGGLAEGREKGVLDALDSGRGGLLRFVLCGGCRSNCSPGRENVARSRG